MNDSINDSYDIRKYDIHQEGAEREEELLGRQNDSDLDSDSESITGQDNSSCDCKPILVADDNEFNLFTLQQLLLSLHFKLEADGACNGKEAADMV